MHSWRACSEVNVVSKRSRRQLDGWAELVIPHLPTHPSPPISVAELMELTGLQARQVHFAIGHIRDEMLGKPDALPLVSGNDGYVLTMEEAHVAAFRVSSARRALTTVTRLYFGAIAPWIARQPADSRQAKQADRQMKRALEDLGDLVTSSNGRA